MQLERRADRATDLRQLHSREPPCSWPRAVHRRLAWRLVRRTSAGHGLICRRRKFCFFFPTLLPLRLLAVFGSVVASFRKHDRFELDVITRRQISFPPCRYIALWQNGCKVEKFNCDSSSTSTIRRSRFRNFKHLGLQVATTFEAPAGGRSRSGTVRPRRWRSNSCSWSGRTTHRRRSSRCEPSASGNTMSAE